VLEGVVTDALAGRSRVVVVRGPVGIGKSTLLHQLVRHVGDGLVATAVGVEPETQLDYSGLHQLCGRMLDHLDRLPGPQQAALATVFGLSAGPPPDRFLVGLATLTLFAEVAERQALICVVDDAHWLDGASVQVLGFVARRLHAERIALVCAARTGPGDDVLAGLPELALHGLDDHDARALLLDNVPGPLDAAVCAQIVAESHGNPLALLALPRSMKVSDLAGGFGLPSSRPVVSKSEQTYVRRLRTLSAPTQLLVLTAAAEPLGDPLLLHRAAATLGFDLAAAGPAVDAGLLSVDGRVEFAHPLVRAAAYRSAAAEDRHAVHRALADATDPVTDPDRRAWHRARAAPGPGEEVAGELERSAGRARARGGVAAEAAFLQRAVALTVDPVRRTARALGAARASLEAGELDAAGLLLGTAEAGAPDELQQARAALLRALIAFHVGRDAGASSSLLTAARRLEPLDPDGAREAYLTAWRAALLAGQGGVALEVGHALRGLARFPGRARPLDALVDAVVALTTEGRAEARPVLQHAARVLTAIPAEDVIRWGGAAVVTAASWDVEGWQALSQRHVQVVRDAGALAELPLRLVGLGLAAAWLGDFVGAASAIAESDAVAAVTGTRTAPYARLRLTALRGREGETSRATTAAFAQAAADEQGMLAPHAHWAAAVLHNGLARYDQAAWAARHATSDTNEPWVSVWALPELVEAASRVGDLPSARDALARLTETTEHSGVDVASGIEARSRALLRTGAVAEELYREAIDRLGRTQVRPELARAHLLYGEWLRREGRRADAREQLRGAHEIFVAIGMEAFAERAHRERVATGERVRRSGTQPRDALTPQEDQIARLARVGFSNPEIGAQLFISARTVEWHLGKVFTKLRISSRRQLRAALPEHDGLVSA
jgi:DNA-binding CsgD family transcriptional regulator